MAVIWDGGLDEERTEVLENTKLNAIDDLELQLDSIVDWLTASGFYTWCEDGVEADDVIGTLAWQAEAEDTRWWWPVDKDFFQLINTNISFSIPMINRNPLAGRTGYCQNRRAACTDH